MTTATSPVVSFRDAAVSIGGHTVWSGLSGDVRGGTFTAILGPNGAGKSTLIKAILGVVPVASGEVTVFGEPAGGINKHIGYLPQRRTFDASVRVRGVDIVRLGLDGHLFGFAFPRWTKKEQASRALVAEAIELVGASAYANRPIGEMSGGEQQRLLIAQALIRKPKILLLDEPLDSLDISNQIAISDLIKSLVDTLGIAALMVAHDVNPIARYLDQVVYIANGKALIGSPSEVITTEKLSQLYDTPIEVLHASDGRVVVLGGGDVASFHGHSHG